MRPSPIAAVVFDAVGTLITPEPDVVSVYFAAGRKYGSRRSPAAIARLFGRAFTRPAGDDEAADRHATDEAAELAFWRRVVAAVLNDLKEPAATACFADLFDHFSRPTAWRVYPDAAAALVGLAARGVELAVASNFDARLHGVVAGHRELAPLGRRFVSSEIGWRKPDPRFFAAVAAGLRLPPGQILYMGDEPDSDVAAAAAAGLHALLVRRCGPDGPGVVTDLTRLVDRIDPTPGRPVA